MISSSSAWRVDLRLKPSRLFFCLALLLHAAVLLAVLTTGLALPLRLAIAAIVLLSLFFSWRQEKNNAGLMVREQETGFWLQAGKRQGLAELKRSQVWRYLVVMDFVCRSESGAWRRRVVVLPDAVDADTFRRLRVRLRHGRRRSTRSAHRFLQ